MRRLIAYAKDREGDPCMGNGQAFFIDFKVADQKRFEKLCKVFEALKEDKHKQIAA